MDPDTRYQILNQPRIGFIAAPKKMRDMDPATFGERLKEVMANPAKYAAVRRPPTRRAKLMTRLKKIGEVVVQIGVVLAIWVALGTLAFLYALLTLPYDGP